MRIINRFTGAVIYEGDAPTAKETVEAAIKAGADLGGAYLGCADDQKITLIGDRPLFSLGTIGSRGDYLYAYITDCGVYVSTGCFFGTLDAFAEAVEKNHGGGVHGKEYRAAIEMIKAHAELWTPVDESNAEKPELEAV